MTTAQSEMPKLSYPRIMLMVTDNVAPSDPQHPDTRKSLVWRIGAPHPFIDGVNIIAIYIEEAVVVVYAAGEAKGKMQGMRDLVPLSRVRIANEAMPLEIFMEELAHSDAGEGEEDDDDDEGDGEPDPASGPVVNTSNGQPASS